MIKDPNNNHTSILGRQPEVLLRLLRLPSLTQHTRRPLVELGHVLGLPPLVEIPVLVELAAAVVEAVRDLVPDDNANAPVVEGLGEGRVVEGRLQDSRGEHWGRERKEFFVRWVGIGYRLQGVVLRVCSHEYASSRNDKDRATK